MNATEMRQLIEEQFERILELREQGQREYARKDDNVFANFERVAERLGISREKVLMTYMEKHLDGIHAWIDGHKSQREGVEGRIDDLIMYALLLRGMVEDGEVDTGVTWIVGQPDEAA